MIHRELYTSEQTEQREPAAFFSNARLGILKGPRFLNKLFSGLPEQLATFMNVSYRFVNLLLLVDFQQLGSEAEMLAMGTLPFSLLLILLSKQRLCVFHSC